MSGLRVSRAAIFWPIYHRHVHFNSKSFWVGRRFLSRRDGKSVTPNFGPKSDQLFDHLHQTAPFSARTFGPKTHVTIVTGSKSDQVFDPFTTDTSILSSNFWSRNCHDRDMNPPRGSFAHEFRNQTGGHLPCGCILVRFFTDRHEDYHVAHGLANHTS